MEDGTGKALQWVALHVLQRAEPLTIAPTGSGDMTRDYLRLACALTLSLIAALVWTLVDRAPRALTSLDGWLRLYLRYALASVMLSYGMSKLFERQFPAPSLERLLQPIGSASPMGLLWTFMGASRPYQIFGGLGEVLGGALLFFRRTTTLGALVLAGVMTNVVMLNFCYDVPVKLYSAQLLFMAVFLLAPDAQRLLDVLVRNRPTLPRAAWEPFASPLKRGALLVVQVLCAGAIVWNTSSPARESETAVSGVIPAAVAGFYAVEDFSELDAAGKAAPLAAVWRQVISARGKFTVERVDGKRVGYLGRVDEAKHTLSLQPPFPDHLIIHALQFDRLGDQSLALAGQLPEGKISLRLVRQPAPEFLLLTRGFHWISEAPFNR